MRRLKDATNISLGDATVYLVEDRLRLAVRGQLQVSREAKDEEEAKTRRSPKICCLDTPLCCDWPQARNSLN